MVNAGASIEAYLRLDATQFREGLDSAKDSVVKFKESMLEVGKQGGTLTTGVNQVSQALTNMIRQMETLDTVDSKAITKLKELGLALEHIATGAQRLGSDMRRGGEGVEMLNTVMDIFTAGMNSAEVTIKATVSQLKNLANIEKSAVNSTNNLKTTFTGVSPAVNEAKMSLVDYGNIERRAYLEERRQAENLRILQKEFNNLALSVEAFNKVQTSAVQREIKDLNRLLSELEKANISRRRTLSISNNFSNPFDSSHTTATERNTAVLERNSQAMRENASETLRNLGYKGKLSAEEAQVRANSYSSSTATQQYTSSLNKNTTATQRQATATRALGKAMSSLRMVGTMVASMMVWNFAHNLITATRETVNAKSEMEGYFKMLNFGQKDIDHFNKALSDTVGQFQRVNKYSLGETISSIGVEFDLSTKEMEKAMKVTSMITSEYLRAGRNANEASLAVKDVLQGQFQRLSRETGVKGEQLKEAGWSGDTNDVLGLMEALEKVGKSRNWDVFAQKANSLNDIVTILQNRFGEWSAEMVYTVQPSIVNTFNAIMSVATQLGGALSGLWQWFNGDGIVETATRWTLIGTAITGVVTALIHYRTGANLVQMVQMGLRGSIMATVLGLKAEEVATYNTRTAITAKITSLKAEEVANIGVRKSLVAKALGLDAVLVRQKGLKGAIMASTFANQLYEASVEGASAEELKAIYLEQQSQLSKMGTVRAIFAKIAGVNMETFAERGLIVALAQRISQTPLYVGSLKAEEVAELSTAEAGFLLMASLLPLVAIITGVAVALYSLLKPLQDSADAMKKFNDIVKNGKDIVKEHKKTYESLNKSYESTKSKLDSMDKSSKKYLRTQKDLKVLEDDKKQAYENWQNSIKAVELAQRRQKAFEEEKDKISIHNQRLLADAYAKAGFSAKESSEMASHELTEAEKGAQTLRETLSRLKWEADRGSARNTKMIDMLDQYGLSNERIKEFGTNMSEAQYKIAEGFEKMMTSEDLMERIGGWFEIQQGRFEEWWTELNAFFEVRDWDSIRDKLIEGLKYVLTGFGAFDWISAIGGKIQEKGIVGAIMEALWGEGDSDGILDIISQWGNDMILQPMADWLNWFLQDPFGNMNTIFDDWSLAVGKFLFGKDSDSLRDLTAKWFDDNVSKPIMDWINGFLNDPFAYLGNALMSVGGFFLDPILQSLFGEGITLDTIVNALNTSLGTVLASFDFNGWVSSVIDLPRWIGEWIGNALGSLNLGEILQTHLGNVWTEAFAPLIQGVTVDFPNYVMSSIGRWSEVFSSLVSTVSGIFNGLKTRIWNTLTGIASNVSTGFNTVKDYAVSKVNAMQQGIKSAIDKVIGAFTHMKDMILSSAKAIWDGVNSKFKSVSDTIGGFYHKLTNPSEWGSAGRKSWSSNPKPNTARKIFSTRSSGVHGAGINPYQKGSSGQTVTLNELVGQLGGNKRVNLSDFLSLFVGSGFGGWDFGKSHKDYIYSKAKPWNAKAPSFNGVTLGNGYKVGRFWNGKPEKFTWEEFMATARAIFSTIPYKFYMDSDWKGDWVSALLSGATNCYDGSMALLSLAKLFGFEGNLVHTNLKNGVGHFFVNIAGHNLDTTHFQNSGSWNPLSGAGVPVRHVGGYPSGKTVTVNVDMSNANIYGIDDLDSRIADGVDKGLQKAINDPYTVAI